MPFPHWRSHARTERPDDCTEFLVVDVTPPSEANVEYGLTIDTAGGEVTVGFDYYHSRFDEWVGDGDHFGTKAALEFIRGRERGGGCCFLGEGRRVEGPNPSPSGNWRSAGLALTSNFHLVAQCSGRWRAPATEQTQLSNELQHVMRPNRLQHPGTFTFGHGSQEAR